MDLIENKFFDVNGNLNDLGIHAAKCIISIKSQFIDDEINAIAKKTNSTVAEVYGLYFAIHNKKKIKKCKKRDDKEIEVINLSQDEKDRLQKIASNTSPDTGKAKIILACDGNPIIFGFCSTLSRDLGYTAGYVSYVLRNFKKSRMGYFKSKYSHEDIEALCDAGCSIRDISEKLDITYSAVENAVKRLALKIKKHDKIIIDRNKLAQLCDKGLCRREIAEEMGFHEDNIDLALRRFDLKAKRQKRYSLKAQTCVPSLSKKPIKGEQKIIQLCQVGFTKTQIKKQIGSCLETINRCLRKYGLETVCGNKKFECEDEVIKQLCDSGLSLTQISNKLGCDKSITFGRLRNLGLKAADGRKSQKSA